jgi:hypothetical protein
MGKKNDNSNKKGNNFILRILRINTQKKFFFLCHTLNVAL